MSNPTLLRIDTSIRVEESVSRRLTDLAVASWRRTNPTGGVVVRDLAADPVPHFDAAAQSARRREDLTADEQARADLADELAQEVADATSLVIGMPLYNWGPPSQLKAWFDHLIASPLARDPQAMAPGLQVDEAILVVARGGSYGDGTPRAGWDHATDWAQKSFTAVGLDLRVVAVEMTLAPGAPTWRSSSTSTTATSPWPRRRCATSGPTGSWNAPAERRGSPRTSTGDGRRPRRACGRRSICGGRPNRAKPARQVRRRVTLEAPSPGGPLPLPAVELLVLEPLDDRLRDDDVLDEIELTSRLIIAASGRETPMSQAEIDAFLGLDVH